MSTSQPSRKKLVSIWLLLVAFHLTVLGSSFLKLGPANTPIILVIAVVQMLLILGYFMEVRYSTKLIWIAAGTGYFWLLIQWTLTLSDYLMRQWH